MNQELQDAINEAKAAIEAAVKRLKAKHVGALIGAAIGNSIYALAKTDAQIDAMSVAEIDTWLDAIEDCPPSGVEG